MGFAVRGLSKSYSGVPVLSDVDLAVGDGEIHALLGANGAGKSTLIKCIGGGTTPTAGEIEVQGRVYTELTPKRARDAGIAIIYQDYSLAASLTVAENIFLGEELRRGPFARRREQERRARALLEQLGVTTIDPRSRVESLRGADQQVVEIVKAIKTQPNLLLLDEPTAALTEAEVETLMMNLRRLRERGLPIVYVTHRLGEVFQVADRVTVLRDGRIVLTGPVAEVAHEQLVEAIAGRPAEREQRRTVRAGGKPHHEVPLVNVEGLVAAGVGPVTFSLRPGEILALYGLVGSGRTELLEALFGARPVSRGHVRFEGSEVRFRNPAQAIASGVALVPSDRLRNSVFAPLTGLENVLLPSMRDLAHGRVVRGRSSERRSFADVGARLGLQPPRPELQANRFSGGNQQKLVVGRWLRRGETLKVMLLDEPTQGVDVGARQDLYEAVRSIVGEGRRAAILTSSDEEEVEAVADRALVLSRGRVVADLAGSEIESRKLLHLAHLGEGRGG